AETEAHIPLGFFAAITKGQAGEELAELGSLAAPRAGGLTHGAAAAAPAVALGFTADGHPVASAGVMRRALQYNAVTGRTIAVHCEEQTLTRGGHADAGAVAPELRIGGWSALVQSAVL